MSYNPCKVSYNLHEIRQNAKLDSTGVAGGTAGGSGGGGGWEKIFGVVKFLCLA